MTLALNAEATLFNGPYRLVRQLGRGAFGFVYLAQDTLLGQPASIEDLILALVGDESLRQRFLAEAWATMRLRHERIVGTRHLFTAGGNHYIVIECLAGASLEFCLRPFLFVKERGWSSAQKCWPLVGPRAAWRSKTAI